eukprot:795347-Rhodomonas_salina.1
MNRNMRLEWRRAAVEIGAREEEQHWREGSRAEKKRRCVNSEERRREKKRSSRVKKRRACDDLLSAAALGAFWSAEKEKEDVGKERYCVSRGGWAPSWSEIPESSQKVKLCAVLEHRDPEGAIALQECRNPCCSVQGKARVPAGRCPLSCKLCVSPAILVAAWCSIQSNPKKARGPKPPAAHAKGGEAEDTI